jgi:RNA polymerase sigma factor (sigma-70 family)
MATPSEPQPLLPDSTESAQSQAASERAKLIEQLFRDHNRSLISFLVTRLHSEAEARDVAQEAYVRLLQLEHADSIGFHRAYLFRIAANLAVDRLRQRTVRARAPTRELFAEWFHRRTPDQEALDAAEQEVLQHALGELPEKAREALTRHFLLGESVASIAAGWGLTDRMVRYHLARALAHCRARLDQEGAS